MTFDMVFFDIDSSHASANYAKELLFYLITFLSW